MALSSLLQAQTARLSSPTAVVSIATGKAKPTTAKVRASDGTALAVQTNRLRSDVLATGTGKDGVERSVRFVTRSRGDIHRNLEFSCMAGFQENGQRAGRIIVSVATGLATTTLGALGLSHNGRMINVVFRIDSDGNVEVHGTAQGIKDLPVTLDDTMDPKNPGTAKWPGWFTTALGSDFSALTYFEPLIKRINHGYRQQLADMITAAGLNGASASASLISVINHREKALSAPIGGPGGSTVGPGTKMLLKGGAACVLGGLAGSLGGPIGAIIGCAAGFDGVVASEMIDVATTPSPPATPPSGSGGTGGAKPDDEGDWGGVCEPPPDDTGDPTGTDGGTTVDPGGGEDPTFIGGGAGCFVAGTPVATPAGAVAIETLTPSTNVWAGAPERATPAEPRAVRRLMEFRSTEVLDLDFGDEVIQCTAPHPFFTGEWTLAGDLMPGNRVLRRDGAWQELKAVSSARREEPVFDLNVAGIHTFFVGSLELLVHNKSRVDPWDDDDIPDTHSDDGD
jgi:hypothetical protein